MDHAALAELIAGEVLEDLDDDEARAAREHLGACARCRGLRRELELLVVAIGVPQRRPPPALASRVRLAVASEARRQRATLRCRLAGS